MELSEQKTETTKVESSFNKDDRKEFEEWKKARGNITKIEIKPEAVADKPVMRKEKKVRTEKQVQAFQKMREALLKKREDNTDIKHTHSKKYNEEMNRAYEKADKVKELIPDAKVVVKSHVGRPKGRKTVKEAPTPAIESDDEEEDKPISPVNKLPPKAPALKRSNTVVSSHFNTLNDYLRKLNGY